MSDALIPLPLPPSSSPFSSPLSSPSPSATQCQPVWDVFCRVIDNWGDVGLCWRLCTDLAARGVRVRLWLDDSSALQFMAPNGANGVSVHAWANSESPKKLADLAPADVWIEAFGCEISPIFIANFARGCWTNCQNGSRNTALNPLPAGEGAPVASPRHRHPIWLNLEYLSAEADSERNHALPSPVQTGPAAGWIKHFFYPGFTPKTGGLLREPGLAQRRAAFDRSAWLASQGIVWQGQRLISLFCYEPAALPEFLRQLDADGVPTLLLVTHGRASQAVAAALAAAALQTPAATQSLERSRKNHQIGTWSNIHGISSLSILNLSPLTQTDFDHLLWACDLNFVRGEDSLVRAIWAQKPFVWQIYPQSDGAHGAKMQAFLRTCDPPPSWSVAHTAWNENGSEQPHTGAEFPPLSAAILTEWAAHAQRLSAQLAVQTDLVTQLLAWADARSAPLSEQKTQ